MKQKMDIDPSVNVTLIIGLFARTPCGLECIKKELDQDPCWVRCQGETILFICNCMTFFVVVSSGH